MCGCKLLTLYFNYSISIKVKSDLSDTDLSGNLIFSTLCSESPSLNCTQFYLVYPAPGLSDTFMGNRCGWINRSHSILTSYRLQDCVTDKGYRAHMDKGYRAHTDKCYTKHTQIKATEHTQIKATEHTQTKATEHTQINAIQSTHR